MIPPPQNNHNFNNLTITHNTRIKPKSNYNQRTLIEQMQKKITSLPQQTKFKAQQYKNITYLKHSNI